MPTDLFLGLPGRWFDGNDHTWISVSGFGTSSSWDVGAAIGLDDITIKWRYGGLFLQDGTPGGSLGGAAAAFVLEGSPDLSSWTAVITDADPVTTASASFPGDFQHTYSFATATYRYWRFRSTGAGNNDIYTISGFADVPPDPPDDPEPGVGVDFDDDGFGTDDEIATYVVSYRIQRGADATITGGASVGSCELVLQNVDPADPRNPANPDNDRFNPLNAAGELYGKLRDGLPMWVGMNADGAYTGTSPRGLFGGRTQDWTPNLVAGSTYAPTVTLTGEDALGWYRRTACRIEDAEGRPQQLLRLEMLDAAGESRVDLAHEIATLPLSAYDGDLLSGLEAINQANGTRHFVKPEDDRTDWYSYTTRNRQWRLDATIDASVDAGSDHATSADWTLSADTVVNEQKASVTPLDFTPTSTTVWKQDDLPFTFSGTRELWVDFDDYVKSPVLDVNYTGTAPTTSLEPFGRTAKITLVSGGTTTVTRLAITGALAKRALDQSYVADDEDSQAGTRGVRAGSEISGQFVGVLANARGIAQHIVWRYASPQFRPTLTVVNWLPYQFEIDLYDIVAVTIAQLSMTARLFEVVGLMLEGSYAPSASSHSHTATYVLQECAVQDDPGWFVLDTSELDSADILAY